MGLYLSVLDRRAWHWRMEQGRQKEDPRRAVAPEDHSGAIFPRGRSAARGSLVLAVIVVSIVCLQTAVGLPQGLAGARTDHANQVLASRVLVNIGRYPDAFVGQALGPYYRVTYIRRMVHIAAVHRLSLFATGAVADYKALGLIADPSPPMTTITVPHNGAELKGTSVLSAIASDSFGITKVEFVVTGEGLSNDIVGWATRSPYGWVGFWRTTTVPNGFYALTSIADNGVGRTAHSPTVSIMVEN